MKNKLKSFRSDLHIHTCLSPCADLLMSPQRVVARALEMDLDMIAVCDHNSAENTRAAMAAAYGTRLTVLPGIEITTEEEVHLLGIFETVEDVLALQDVVYTHLPHGLNDEALFGQQIVANEWDEVEGFNPRLLLSAVELNARQVVDEIHRRRGLAAAAHIDREAFGLIGQLGFIPEDLELDALEISAATPLEQALNEFPGIENFPLLRSSDAHHPDEIGMSVSTFWLQAPSFDEIRAAFKKRDGRTLEMEV